MSFKLFISEYTYRTDDQQMAVFAKHPDLADAPTYTPDDLHVLFRPNQRKSSGTLVASSTACFAKTENRGTVLEGLEDGFQWRPGQPKATAVAAWKAARVLGVSRVGGRISAERKDAKTREAIELIRADWPKTSHEFPTDVLLDRCGLSLNTVKKHLGPRPVAQHNYRVKHGRQIKQLVTTAEPREKIDFCVVYIFQIEEGITRSDHRTIRDDALRK